MTGISQTFAMITRLWRVVIIVFVLLSVYTNSDQTSNAINNTKQLLKTTESPVHNVTTESSLIPHVNITAVTGKYRVCYAHYMH